MASEAPARQDPADQLVLGLMAPPEPRLDQGVIGRNAACLKALHAFALEGEPGQSLLIWGAPSSGKTFWLRAWAAALAEQKRPHQRLNLGHEAADTKQASEAADPRVTSLSQDPLRDLGLQQSARKGGLWLVDAIDEANPDEAAALFRLLVQLRERGERLLATSRSAPLHMRLREDLRTRLGQALIFELHELSDAEQLAALRGRAHALGWTISPEAPDYDRLFGYMLTRLPRNLALLIQLLDATNARALALRRPISLPLVKQLFDQSLSCA